VRRTLIATQYSIKEEGSMTGRFVRIIGIVAVASPVLLAAGSAAQSLGAGSKPSEPAASVTVNELRGTWRGSFHILGAAGSNSSGDRQGDVVLEIKDDGTYKLTSTRRGATTSDSGTVVANGRRVNLNSSMSGRRLTLTRNGDTLFGVGMSGQALHSSSGNPVQVAVRRASEAAERSTSESTLPRFAPDSPASRSAPARDGFQSP
jgi:hypothetical protein